MPLQHVRSGTANKRPVATNLADGQISVNYHSDSPGIYAKDTNNALFKVGPIHVGTTAPNSTPAGSSGNSRGEGWFDTSGTNPVLKVWNGTAWATVQPITSGTVVSTADTGTVTSTMIADGTITNTDINASAAIALSKLATGALPTAITVASANLVDGTIVDADINASAAIAHSKLASLTAGNVLLGNASNVPTATALSGDVTVTSTGVTAIKSSVALTGTPTAPTAGAGTNTTQIATTAFVTSAVDAARQGLTYKQGCRAATTGPITLSGTQTIDGVAVAAGERVLVKNQSTASENGIYVVAAGAWSRATDFDASADLADGAFVFVEEGTANADTGWVLSTDGAITVGTTALTFVQFSGAGTYSAGNGLQLSGTQFSLAALPSANLLIGNSSNVATATAVTGDVTISNTGVTAIGASKVTNAMLAGSIADSKLSTISTAGKVANSATTATNLNTASAIVARDASGNFSAGTITATLSGSSTSCTGNSATSTALSTSRTFALTGDVTGSVSSDLTSGASIATTIAAGVIVDADVNASAAIAHSKLASITAGSVLLGNASNVATATALSGDVTVSSSGVTAIGAGVVVNADISASAAIAHSKLASVTAGQVLLGNASNVATATALSGDVTVSSTGVTAIGAGVIVNADISATAEIAVSKLANGTARQLLQTASNGTDVEWATNIDVPGTLDVTGVATFDSTVTCNSTGAITIPDGTTAQRPGSPSAGMIRLNTTIGQFEGYSGTAWGTIGGGAKGGGPDQVFFENDQVVTTSYTLTSGKNAVTAGPVTVNSGITVTIPSGSVWSIV